MDLHTKITKKIENFIARRRKGHHQHVDITADEFTRFIINHGVVDRVLAMKKGLPIKRIDDTKPWGIDNIEVRQLKAVPSPKAKPKTKRDRQPNGLSKPLDRDGVEVLTIKEWIATLKEDQA